MSSGSASADDPAQGALRHHTAGDPFQSWCDESAWYPDPVRENSLKLLLHLAPYSDLLLVTGDEGSGRSLFLSRFVASAGDTWRILALPGGPVLDDAMLLESLDQELSVRPDGGEAGRDERLRRLRRSLFVLRRGALLPVLVLDDAHLLPQSAFDLLLELTEPREDGEKPIAVVLAGEAAALGSRIQAAGSRLQDRVAHVFELQSFTEAGTDAYIRHRLALAGQESGGTFTPAVVRFIHTAARGLPGRINEFARVVLEEGQRKRRKADVAVPAPASSVAVGIGADAGILLRYGLAALVLALGAIVFVYRDEVLSLMRSTGDDIGSVATEGVRELSDSADVFLSADAQDSGEFSDLIESEDIFSEDTTRVRSRDATDTSAFPEVSTETRELTDQEDIFLKPPEPARESAGSEAGVAVPAPASAGARDSAPVERIGQAIAQAIVQPGEPGSTPVPGPDSAAAPDPDPDPALEREADSAPGPAPRREAWLLEQAPDAWTVQLFASREERVLSLMAEHGLDADAAVFRARAGDPPLYALIWGVFPSRAEAIRAMEGDLARITGLQPWVRSLADVQTAIRGQQ